MDVDALIETLGLVPHPEGGLFVETWRDPDREGRRGSGTAIYFLLRKGERSHWHRIDATEIWHFYAGAPLELSIASPEEASETFTLGTDFSAGQVPQVIVSPHAWQSARSTGEYSLVGCTVSPAFRFDTFELAAPLWSPQG